jgi:preprotein translocase subunit YajC
MISLAQAADPAAPAAPSGAPASPGLASFLPLIIIFVLFYFLLIRPQTRKAKEHKAMIAALAKGDEVVTTGGLLGRVTALDESFVTLAIAPNVEVRVQRHAVAQLMPKGTAK